MDDILTTEEVVMLLGKHVITIYRYNREGLLMPIRIEPGRKRQLLYTIDMLLNHYFKGQRTRAELERDVLRIREQKRLMDDLSSERSATQK